MLEDMQARGAVQGVMPGREARACSPVRVRGYASPGGGAGRDARA